MNGQRRTRKLIKEKIDPSWINGGPVCLTPPTTRNQKMKNGSDVIIQRSSSIPSQYS